MGRSVNSRNRVFVEDGEGIRTQAFDPSKLSDPSLIIYAPDTNYWNYISENWEKVYHVPSAAGDGMSEHDYSEILDLITNTI